MNLYRNLQADRQDDFTNNKILIFPARENVEINECAKFRGFHVIALLLVQNFFSWLICGSEIFSLGYFVGLKVFHVDISWVGMFFLWVFRGFESFSRGYFVFLHFFLVSISWVQGFSRGYFVGPKFFLLGFSWVQIFSRGYLVGIVCH